MNASSALKGSDVSRISLDDNLDAKYPSRRSSGGSESVATLPLRAPSFDGYVYVATARRAARLNASSATQSEYTSLLTERSRLLDKLFSEKITRQEENRLAYVRWSLERIEDAWHGDALDELESAIEKYEQFQRDLSRLGRQLGVEMGGGD